MLRTLDKTGTHTYVDRHRKRKACVNQTKSEYNQTVCSVCTKLSKNVATIALWILAAKL